MNIVNVQVKLIFFQVYLQKGFSESAQKNYTYHF